MDSLRLEDKCKFGELLEGDKVTVGGEGFLEDMSSPRASRQDKVCIHDLTSAP